MANLNENLVDAQVDEKLKADVIAAVKTLVQLLPFLVELTKEQRKGKKAIQDHLIGFCRDMQKAMQDIPRCKPEKVDLDNLSADVSVWDLMKSIAQDLASLSTKVSDTQLQSGHESYQAAKLGYGMLELFGKNGDTDCMTRYKDIQKRYFEKITGPRPPKEGKSGDKSGS